VAISSQLSSSDLSKPQSNKDHLIWHEKLAAWSFFQQEVLQRGWDYSIVILVRPDIIYNTQFDLNTIHKSISNGNKIFIPKCSGSGDKIIAGSPKAMSTFFTFTSVTCTDNFSHIPWCNKGGNITISAYMEKIGLDRIDIPSDRLSFAVLNSEYLQTFRTTHSLTGLDQSEQSCWVDNVESKKRRITPVFLVQHKDTNFNIRQCLERRSLPFTTLTYKSKSGDIFLPNSTWTTGRNSLYSYYSTYPYFIAAALFYEIPCKAYPCRRMWADAILNCFSPEAHRALFPYESRCDHFSWHASQLDLIWRANAIKPFAFTFLNVKVSNPQHSGYPRDFEHSHICTSKLLLESNNTRHNWKQCVPSNLTMFRSVKKWTYENNAVNGGAPPRVPEVCRQEFSIPRNYHIY
jgi:hypothetical protein